MMDLAVRSLRHRTTSAAATFVAALLGTALIGSFGTLAESAFSNDGRDRESLLIMGAVIGGWGAIIVLDSVAATAGITVRQRMEETGLLRAIGATSAQVKALIGREVLVVALLASLVGAGAAAMGGQSLFYALRRAGLVSTEAQHTSGALALLATVVLVVLTSRLAAAIVAARATKGSAALTLREADVEPPRMHRWRRVVGLVLGAYGVGSVIVTLTITGPSEHPYDEMWTAGPSSILVGVGLAVVAPSLLRWFARPATWLLAWFPSGYLAAFNTTRRAHLLSGVLAPVVVLTASAIGTLALVGIDQRTMHDPSLGDAVKLVTTLNHVVTGMIVLFAAIMVANAFVAVVTQRRVELRRLRLAGATAGQASSSVVVEACIVGLIGIGLGGIASLTTIVPFAVVRGEGLVPDDQLWTPTAVAVTVVALTIASAWGTARRTVRGPVRP